MRSKTEERFLWSGPFLRLNAKWESALPKTVLKPGDMVKKGQIMGLSGATGLAGGDHLHFSMQIDGVQTNPIEWWDEHWIHDRILSKVGSQ